MKRLFLACAVVAVACSWAMAQKVGVSVAKFRDGKRAALCLTFDDGLAEHYTIVAPELEKRGMRGTFGVCSSTVNADSLHIERPDRMTWPQLRAMAERGHEIANHGWAHRNHGRTPMDEVRRDIEMNDSAILANVGIKPPTFFYPNNTKTREGVAVAEAGRVGSRTFQRSVGSKWTQGQLEAWIGGVIDTCGWAVAMTHGITYGYDAFKDKRRLTDFLDFVKSREANLWIGRLQDVVAYAKERDNIKIDVKDNGRKLTVTPTLTLDPALFSVPLTLIVTGGDADKVTATQGGRKLKVAAMADGRAVFDFNPWGGAVEVKTR